MSASAEFTCIHSFKVILVTLALISHSTASSSSSSDTTKCNESLISSNGCNDPFGNECVDSSCSCRPNFNVRLIQDKDSVICLQPASRLDDLCWTSHQCTAENSQCRRIISGRILTDVLTPLWESYVKSGGSSKFIPGRCRCSKGYRPLMTYNENSYEARQVCRPRDVGSSCRTSYECYTRVKYTSCNESRCVCSPGFAYDSHDDLCFFHETNDGRNETCMGGICIPWNPTNNTGNPAGIFIVTVLMVMAIVGWGCLCGWTTFSEGCQYKRQEMISQLHGHIDEDYEGTSFRNDMCIQENDCPPTYDEVVTEYALMQQDNEDGNDERETRTQSIPHINFVEA